LRDRKQHTIRIVEGLAEIILLALIYYFCFRRYGNVMGVGGYAYRGKYVLVGIYVVLVFLVFKVCDSFNIGNLKIIDLAVSQGISMLIVNTLTYFQLSLIANRMIDPIPLLILTLADVLIAAVCAYFFTKIYHKNYAQRDMILIYGSDNALGICDKFNSRADKYCISETMSSDEDNEVIFESIRRHDSVILNDIPVAKRNQIVKYCYANNIRTYMVPRITDVLIRGAQPLTLFDTPLCLIDGYAIKTGDAFIKRAIDIIISAIALIPCSLIMAAIAIAIKLEDGGAVLYRQSRVTLNDRDFDMLKFRSMIMDAEKYTGAVLAEEDDPRITKTGRFLRKHRLDELPQILNILKGDMSIVGPRPERRALKEEIEKTMPEFAFRTKVKGGLTGYAQVYGKYNTTSYDKLKMDLMYIENYSILLDLKLILMTPQILFRKESTEGVKK